MNFLAHLYLSERTDGSFLGALYGDFLKGYRVSDFPLEIQRGIRLHQYIDTFTDDHPAFRRSKRRIDPSRRRYAGVIIDIFYDHFLAKYWSDYSEQSLEMFTQKVYQLLEKNMETLPGRLQGLTPHMIREDWLMAYGTDQGIDRTFRRLSRRIRRENQVDESLLDLQLHRPMLYQDFTEFFPALQAQVEGFAVDL